MNVVGMFVFDGEVNFITDAIINSSCRFIHFGDIIIKHGGELVVADGDEG